MNFDLTHLFDRWDYTPGQVLTRRIKGRDGTTKIQMRIDLGILQMNCEGRPDGKRPLGHESYFDYYAAQCEKRRTAGENFALSGEDCFKLQQELIQYHHRYICLFELEDFEAAIRDAQRNLSAIAFAEANSESSELAWSLLQFQPQVLMLLARARGTQALNAGQFEAAQQVVAEGISLIRNFYEGHAKQELMEHCGEVASLESWAEAIHTSRPLSDFERLEKDLQEALRREDYEKAAQVRDALRKLKPSE